MTLTLVTPKEKKIYETAAAVRERILASSKCTVTTRRICGAARPDFVEIELFGDAAKIPSTKNRRIPIRGNRSIPNDTAKGFLKALDMLYAEALGDRAIRFGREPLFLLVISCKRSAACDLDNVLTAVRDWLEPATKAKGGKHARGWGIGIVDDDRNVQGLIVPSSMLGAESDTTRIIIRPLALVRERLLGFVAGVQA